MACSVGDSGLTNALPSHFHLPRKNLNESSSAAGLGAAGGVPGAAATGAPGLAAAGAGAAAGAAGAAAGLAAGAAAGGPGGGAAGFGCAPAEPATTRSENVAMAVR